MSKMNHLEIKKYIEMFAKNGLQWICDDEDAFSTKEMEYLLNHGGRDFKEWNKVLKQHYSQQGEEVDYIRYL